jgi:hypothetical protein
MVLGRSHLSIDCNIHLLCEPIASNRSLRDMSRVSITAWKTLPPPQQREPLSLAAVFDSAETELLVLGLRPAGMDDKWFICFHQGWLLFHRSWTGVCIYGLQLERLADGVQVSDSWVSRDPAQYKGADLEYDRKLVRFLIEALLLKRAATFPMPPGVEHMPPGAYQHSIVGRAYPESPAYPPAEPPGP